MHPFRKHNLHEKDYVLARKIAEQAQFKANHTEATACAAKAQQATDEVQKNNLVLRNEIDSNTK